MTMKKYLLTAIGVFFVVLGQAQNAEDKAYIRENTNIEALQAIQQRIKARQEKYDTIPHADSIILINGQTAYFSGFTPDGQPMYDVDDNLGSILTHHADEIKTGGVTGLDLDGSGIEIGHWEAGGLARHTHVELQGKVFHQESANITSHATHTAGTMVSEGYDEQAQGFAPEATILSWQSNDDEAEVVDFAMDGGILSNHSYGSGNPNGSLEGYGKYSFNSGEWDDILYNAPYLFSCKSAGNTRNDGVNTADQGYDLIYTVGVSKNVMTIGAVVDLLDYQGPQSVQQSSFSSWGPTDDWRIKPDIVANGVSLYSCDDPNDSAYTVKSGTSMSAPSVTGSVALLQQYYYQLTGVYMKAATLKALLINTAEEAGAEEGPDFQNGWGLMNARKAADLITDQGENSFIKETSIENGAAYFKTFYFDGTSPVHVTIAWNDPGTLPLNGTDNTTPLLVNDLDMRFFSTDSTYLPWMLEPNMAANNFEDPALRGDNYRDNVERIDISSLPAGNYTVLVTHKDILHNGYQDFSLVISGMTNTTAATTNFENEPQFKIYPNPAQEQVTIEFLDIQGQSTAQLQIFDFQGRLVRQKQISQSQEVLNTSELSPGVYMIQVKREHSIFQEKLIIGQ